LALRVGQTYEWQKFTLIRGAPRSGEMKLTFALTGLGEAQIDAVSVRALEQAPGP